MKKINIEDDKLVTFLKDRGLDKPSANFAYRLKHNIVEQFKRNYAVEYKKEERLGKCIIAVLVFFNLLMLYYLNPFSIQPMISISVAAFILGLVTLIIIIKKNKTGYLNSDS